MFQGSMVALVTPFKNGRVDEQALGHLVEFHIANGTDAIVPCGCTGEAATLTHEEQIRTIRFVVEAVSGRVPVVAGTGSNSTSEAILLTQGAKKACADGALMITPYYNKPTAEGQYQHYKAVASQVDIPIMLYNVPSRTGINMTPETVAHLSEIDNIVAIKEASGDLDQVSQILSLCDITVLSGDDSLTLPMLAVGAEGVVSVAANVMPKSVSEFVSIFLSGDAEGAKALHLHLLPLFKALFFETNPMPVKKALHLMGMIEDELRLPLVSVSADTEKKLVSVLESYGLIDAETGRSVTAEG